MDKILRDEIWLQELFDTAWDTYFADVPQVNDVRVVFGRRAKRRLGSISLDPNDRTVSIITMNGLFRLEEVPEYVVLSTMIHELTHYAHGFNSPLAQAQAHPHAGGVMRREFAERGALALYQEQKKWLKANWPALLAREFPVKVAVRSRRTVGVPRPFWFVGRD
jgi:hypothetical protein